MGRGRARGLEEEEEEDKGCEWGEKKDMGKAGIRKREREWTNEWK